ncbi:MAG: hypothetical protein A3F54_00160 [Candidatus Kerfeldbacteria bacterium RIFCSPHIGHO2_12_FULL_48_17]|uniref:VOC domain-containing protein n=1 Tax=Candidatus Kerfeldbacteria bacterium RIFCSPHIGHO2_12_FULL_48_17 TaxID=1798542 RepID=A0A1G2BAN2_9BACT|nr:MAG: hypothetical protein A3F54_00160 [Candidatus Kerfeldbacteria bacterium RIFCSPHIGHO2_12_FULL_48_17]
MITKINATVLFVKKFDECVKFYKNILELKPKMSDKGFQSFDVKGQELALMDLTTAAQMINETIIQPTQVGPHRVLLAAFMEDTDKAYKNLKAKGVEFIKPPTTQPWGQRTAYFQDPEGNIWEISHFIKKNDI